MMKEHLNKSSGLPNGQIGAKRANWPGYKYNCQKQVAARGKSIVQCVFGIQFPANSFTLPSIQRFCIRNIIHFIGRFTSCNINYRVRQIQALSTNNDDHFATAFA